MGRWGLRNCRNSGSRRGGGVIITINACHQCYLQRPARGRVSLDGIVPFYFILERYNEATCSRRVEWSHPKGKREKHGEGAGGKKRCCMFNVLSFSQLAAL